MRSRNGIDIPIHSLSVSPIEGRRAKELSSSVMEPPSIVLYVPGQRRGQSATLGGNPVDDGAFETLGIVCAGTGRPLLYLSSPSDVHAE